MGIKGADLKNESLLQIFVEPGTFKCARSRCKFCPFVQNADEISGPKRSVKITDRFTCTSENVIYCITCTLCKKLYIGGTGRRLGDRFREHLRDVEKDDKDASKPVARHFNLPNHSKEHMSICGLSLHQGTTDSRKIWSKDSFFKSAPLIPTESTNAFHSINLFLFFSRYQVSTNSVAPSSVYKAYITHNSSICFDEGLTLETSAFQSLYGGQFTLSTPLINQINLYMEELDQFRPIRAGFAQDLDKLADLLDAIVINLKEVGRQEELIHGTLYLRIQKKMTESMLANYNTWVFERKKPECVETLREWIIQEGEFQTVAAETLCGVAGKRREGGRTFFGQTKPLGKTETDCEYCKKDHPLWRCEEFKKMDVRSRWRTANQLRVCFCCLRRNHTNDQCTRSKPCGIDGCQRTHNSLLHGDPTTRDDGVGDGANQEPGTVRPEGRGEVAAGMTRSRNGPAGSSSGTERERMVSSEHSLTTTMTASKFPEQTHFVGLRTVPVVVKNGSRKLVLNALLDDASTKSYINEDVAAELGLEGTVQNITVNVLNGKEGSFQTMPVEFGMQSVDGRTSTRVSAFTTTRVTGDMRPIDWKVLATKWKHLQGIYFPNLGPRPIVDMLIGIDYAELHYSIKDIRGQPGEPVARLTPLGWTCIGAADVVDGSSPCTNLNVVYFVHSQEKELTSVLQRF